jgi:hypothetical protein
MKILNRLIETVLIQYAAKISFPKFTCINLVTILAKEINNITQPLKSKTIYGYNEYNENLLSSG